MASSKMIGEAIPMIEKKRGLIMLEKNELLEKIKELQEGWSVPENCTDIPHGDMPGDKVEIGKSHIEKASTLFPELLKILPSAIEKNEHGRAVIAVCGGSGVGKSENASLLTFFFNQAGIGCYTLSGDNYPHRIPMYNDAERLRIFQKNGLKGMIKDDVYTEENFQIIHQLQKKGDDANEANIEEHPFINSYIEGGKDGLRNYLGTVNEIEFQEMSRITSEFKQGMKNIWLKRMGRSEGELWYEKVDFSDKNILIIEWTHGNSDNYSGVDIPILLNSTPQETLEHRKARNRDGKTDSPFTMRVLELEQEMLEKQAHKAKIILSKAGELLTYDAYCKLMEESKSE